MIKKCSLLSIILLVLLSGCSSTTYISHYLFDFHAAQVETTSLEFAQTQRGIGDTLVYRNEAFTARWLPTPNGEAFQLTLINTSGQPIALDWDRGAYVDVSGISRKLIHGEINRFEQYSSIPASIIAPGSRFSGFVGTPTYRQLDLPRRVTVTSEQTRQQRETSISDFSRLVESFNGKTVDVLLPISIGQSNYTYLFKFRLRDGGHSSIDGLSYVGMVYLIR